jgi:dynein heavy chain
VIQQVVALVEPLEALPYSPFDPACAAQWRATTGRFYGDNEAIKAATRQLIDTSFR